MANRGSNRLASGETSYVARVYGAKVNLTPFEFPNLRIATASGWLQRLVRRSIIRRWYGVRSVYHWAMLQMDTRYSMGVLPHSQAPRNYNEHRMLFEMQQTRARLCSDPVPRNQLSICHARQSQSAQSPNLEL